MCNNWWFKYREWKKLNNTFYIIDLRIKSITKVLNEGGKNVINFNQSLQLLQHIVYSYIAIGSYAV